MRHKTWEELGKLAGSTAHEDQFILIRSTHDWPQQERVRTLPCYKVFGHVRCSERAAILTSMTLYRYIHLDYITSGTMSCFTGHKIYLHDDAVVAVISKFIRFRRLACFPDVSGTHQA